MHAGTNDLSYPTSQCHFCLEEYQPTTLEQKYCSQECKKAKYNERKYGHESAKRYYNYLIERQEPRNEQQGRYCLHCNNC